MYVVDPKKAEASVKKLCEALKKRREELGISLYSVKIPTGKEGVYLSRSTLISIESGEAKGTQLYTILLYCEYLGLEVVIKKKDE